jgi:CHAT domain-containing protein
MWEAETDLLRSVEVAGDGDSPYFLAEAYHNLFHLYDDAALESRAVEYVDRFVETVQPLEHSPLRMTAWLDSGELRWKLGWHAAAFEAYSAAVNVVNEHDEYHNFAGEFFERNGNLALARDYYRRGIEAGGGAAISVRAHNLAGLTRVFLALGQADSAEVMARAHDAMITEPADTPLLPGILVEQGRFGEAIRTAEEWVQHRVAGGSARAITAASLVLSSVLIESGRPARAIPPLDRADSLARQLNLTDEQIESLRLRGLALAATGDTVGGLRSLEQAAELALEHPTTLNIHDTHVALADLLAAADRHDEALATYERAAEQEETTTSSLDVDFDRVRFRNRHLEPYDGAIAAILTVPDDASRNRDLLRWSARRKAAALEVATSGTTVTAENGWEDTDVELGVAGHAFVDYLVSGDAVAALVVRRDRLSLHRLPLPVDSISKLVTRLRAPLTATSGGRIDLARARFDVNAAHELYRALWEPLSEAIGDADRVVVSPDGPLHRVPFVALVSALEEDRAGRLSAERFVLDDYEIEYVPSARYLRRGSASLEPATDGPARVLAVAYEAPGAEAEVASISEVWPAGRVRIVMAGDATESAIRDMEGDYDIVHYATHAVANDRDPLASFIRLGADPGADGLYHLSEIVSRPRDQELVVLSGCETQTGELYAGEGLMGLTRAFLVSGARAVLATQWPVGAATASLMEEFYGRLATGDDPSEALRSAQLMLRSDPETAHPFYWAGFVLHRRD